MKAIHCLIAGIIFSAFVSDAGAADHQKGIKILIDAASRHHRSAGSANVGADDKQRGIKTLIEAATASRHPRPLSRPGPHAAKDTGRGDGGKDVGGKGDHYMDRTLRDLSSGAIAARQSPAPKAARGPGQAATRGAATGAGGASVSGVNAGAATPGARTRAGRRLPFERQAQQNSFTVTGVPSLPGRGTLNGTGIGRPPPAIGGAAISTNAGRLNGTAVRSKH
jgi:hypothetical protein